MPRILLCLVLLGLPKLMAAGTEKNIIYKVEGSDTLRLDLYLPDDAQAPVPLVVWIHGGSWQRGSKDDPNPTPDLVKQGYAVACINYRLSHQALFPAQIIDCQSAIRWLKARAALYGIDSARVGVWGASAGGHLSALVGTAWHYTPWTASGPYGEVSGKVQAVCDWYGPTDFLRMNDVPGHINHHAPGSPESKLLGGPIEALPEQVKQANPITYITRSTPPFLIMHGSNDLKVIPNQSERLHQALQAQGQPSELLFLEGLGHGGAGWDAEVDQVLLFFNKHLKDKTNN
ncbi:MAG: alpha/beta hydrolase [Cytophagales bacterium]|nr:alpha/beta hydrolase [Cytophagales bacterium]